MKLTPEVKKHLESLDGGLYFELKECNGMILGLCKYAFTLAIVVDINNDGTYEHRYCYPYEKALECLMAYELYEGIDDPKGGWIKNKGWNRDRYNPEIEEKHIK